MFFQYGENNMNSKSRSNIIIFITVGILIALSPIIIFNLSLIAGNNNKKAEYSDEINLDKENLKLSKISERIHIINNSGWVAFKDAGNCTGNGTYSEPYVIKDLIIDGGGAGSCIYIENSDAYFKIENCTVYNSSNSYNVGIRLSNVYNGELFNNNCSDNYGGIYLENSYSNIITGNTANNNYHSGINLYNSHYNEITENIASSNVIYGIKLFDDDNNIISGNTVNYNILGIGLLNSDYNI